MMKTLSYEEYERLSEGGGPVPVYREVPGDLRTPVSAFLVPLGALRASVPARERRGRRASGALLVHRSRPRVDARGPRAHGWSCVRGAASGTRRATCSRP